MSTVSLLVTEKDLRLSFGASELRQARRKSVELYIYRPRPQNMARITALLIPAVHQRNNYRLQTH